MLTYHQGKQWVNIIQPMQNQSSIVKATILYYKGTRCKQLSCNKGKKWHKSDPRDSETS